MLIKTRMPQYKKKTHKLTKTKLKDLQFQELHTPHFKRLHFDPPQQLKPLKDVNKKNTHSAYLYSRTQKKKKIIKIIKIYKNQTFPPRKMVLISTRTEPLDSAMLVKN